MRKPVWRKGPPPSIGWWPASEFKDKTSIRWWDGERWSRNARPQHTAAQAAGLAYIKTTASEAIYWCDRWWDALEAREQA